MTTPLEGASLFYRRPDLYDRLRADDEHPLADRCRDLIDRFAPHARTVLDVGCGTGRDLEHLAGRFHGVGVDVGPRMVTYARRARPQLRIHLGDMRSVRLGHRVDVVLCVGNALAYLHEDHDIAAAFTTFAAHAAPGGLLVVQTVHAPVDAAPATSRIDVVGLHAEVTVSYDWDATRRVSTLRRQWHHDDGGEDHDVIERRPLGPAELAAYAIGAGFTPQDTDVGDGWLVATNRCQGLPIQPGVGGV